MMEEIIAAVFAEMSALYGKKFADQWSGVDPETLKSVWADKLSRYANRPEVIRKALDSCENNPWPPTLPEFIGLCNAASCSLARNEKPFVREPDPWEIIEDKRSPEEKTINQQRAQASIAALMEKIRMKK